MSVVDPALVRRVVNETRALEAHARVAKVLGLSLRDNVVEATAQLGTDAPAFGPLRNAVEQFIAEADDLHAQLTAIAQTHGVPLPGDDDDDVPLPTPQSGGGK